MFMGKMPVSLVKILPQTLHHSSLKTDINEIKWTCGSKVVVSVNMYVGKCLYFLYLHDLYMFTKLPIYIEYS